MTFIYENIITKQQYKLSGLRDLAHAWKLVGFAANRNGWNVFDIKIK